MMFCWTKTPPPPQRRRRAMARMMPFAVAPQTAPALSSTRPQGTSTTRSPPGLPLRHEVDTRAAEEAPRARGSVCRYTVSSRVAVVEKNISRSGQISTGLVPVRDGVASCRRYRRTRNVSQAVPEISVYLYADHRYNLKITCISSVVHNDDSSGNGII
jgi:hypothetical protein